MKTFYRLVSIAVFCAAMTAISCSEATTDVNDNGGSIIPSNPSKPEEPDNTKVRKISKITLKFEDYNDTRSYTFDYDANERVSKFRVEASGANNSWEYNIRYYDDELNIFYSDEHDSSGYAFISLNKSGYIASTADEWEEDGYACSSEQTFEYNLQGYLQEFEDVYYEIDENGDESTEVWGVTYKWSSGNIASREYYETEDGEEDYSERWTMTYNNKKQDVINLDINAFVEYYSYDIGVDGFDGSIALALGLVGKTNKNLITKSVGECSDGEIYEITYKWSYDEDGYPIQCTADGWYTIDSVLQEDIDAYSCEFEYVD